MHFCNYGLSLKKDFFSTLFNALKHGQFWQFYVKFAQGLWGVKKTIVIYEFSIQGFLALDNILKIPLHKLLQNSNSL